jgi:hypothetical protein
VFSRAHALTLSLHSCHELGLALQQLLAQLLSTRLITCRGGRRGGRGSRCQEHGRKEGERGGGGGHNQAPCATPQHQPRHLQGGGARGGGGIDDRYMVERRGKGVGGDQAPQAALQCPDMSNLTLQRLRVSNSSGSNFTGTSRGLHHIQSADCASLVAISVPATPPVFCLSSMTTLMMQVYDANTGIQAGCRPMHCTTQPC